MSYILDALKRAERERGTTRVPMLTRADDPPGRRRNRLVAIAFGLLVCTAAVLLFFWPSLTAFFQQPKPLPVTAEQNRVAIGPRSEQVGETPGASSTLAPLSPQASPATSRSGHHQSTFVPGAHEGDGRSASIAQGESRNVPPPAVGVFPIETVLPRPDSDAATPSPVENVPAPRSAQAGGSLEEVVARMTLNILVYEEAEADRRVFINGKKYMKGDLVEGKYLIERITIEGATLSYEGARVLLRPR